MQGRPWLKQDFHFDNIVLTTNSRLLSSLSRRQQVLSWFRSSHNCHQELLGAVHRLQFPLPPTEIPKEGEGLRKWEERQVRGELVMNCYWINEQTSLPVTWDILTGWQAPTSAALPQPCVHTFLQKGIKLLSPLLPPQEITCPLFTCMQHQQDTPVIFWDLPQWPHFKETRVLSKQLESRKTMLYRLVSKENQDCGNAS